MEHSEHVFLRNVDVGQPGLLIANLLRPLQLAPNASVSLSTLNVSTSSGLTIDGEIIGAAYGNLAGVNNRVNLFIAPSPGSYSDAELGRVVSSALNRISTMYDSTVGSDFTNDLNRNALIGASLWSVSPSATKAFTFNVTSVSGFTGQIVPIADFGLFTNCAATANGVVTATGAGFMTAEYTEPISSVGMYWFTIPNNLAAGNFDGTLPVQLYIHENTRAFISVSVISPGVVDGEYVVNLNMNGVSISTTTVNSGAGNGIAVGFGRERGGVVLAWQDSTAYSIDITAGILFDTRIPANGTAVMDYISEEWTNEFRVSFNGYATSNATAFSDIWVTPMPAFAELGAVTTIDRGFAPGGLADELGFINTGITTDEFGDFVDGNYTARGVSQTLISQTASRNDAVNGALIVTSDDLPVSGRIADMNGSARDRALIDFITTSAGVNGEAVYEQAYPRHCYIKNRDIISLQQMSIRLLDNDGTAAGRVRPGGCAMLTFHNVVR